MNNLTNLKNEAHKIQLSYRERELLRASIFGNTEATPSYAVSRFSFFSVRFVPVLAGLLVVLLGGGSAYAAQAALPGDLLYAVKVNVNEPVKLAFAVSAEAKAAAYADVAETRLEEAEALAAEGRLSASTRTQIEESFDAHLAEVEELTLALQEEDPDTADELSAELEARFLAHGSILESLGRESRDEETREHSTSFAGRLAGRVVARADTARGTLALKVAPAAESMSLMVDEGSVASDTALMATSEIEGAGTANTAGAEAGQRAAAQLHAKAEAQLAAAKQIFEAMDDLDATTTARVAAQFKTLEAAVAAGEERYVAGDYAGARAAFSGVLGDASALGAYLRAEKKFDRKFLRMWMDKRFGSWQAESHTDWPEPHGEHEPEETENELEQEDEEENEDDEQKQGSLEADVKVRVNLGL